MPQLAAHLDQQKLRELWFTDLTCEQIGEQLGVSKSTVSKYATRKLGLPLRELGSRALPQKTVEVLYTVQKWPSTKIARHFKVSTGAVLRVLRARGVHVRPYRIKEDPLIGLCVRLRRQGKSYRHIASLMGCSERKIGNRIRLILGPQKKWNRRS